MTKTPAPLKWLAEKRGRLANDVLQTGRMAQELVERHQKLQAQLAAVDETMRLYDASLDPHKVAPVAHWKGRHGKRGQLRQALLDLLGQHSPDWVAADNVERFLISRFGLSFASATQRAAWRANSLGAGLRRLAEERLVERLDAPEVRTGKPGFWRLKQDGTQSLADL